MSDEISLAAATKIRIISSKQECLFSFKVTLDARAE